MPQSQVAICNRALQLLGAEPIGSLTDNTKAARALKLAYDPIRRAELRSHPWNFATKRANLAASTIPPVFNRANAFPLPSDFIRLLPTDPEKNYNTIDYEIENGQIITNYPAPLQVRYIYDCEDVTKFDPLFCEALSAKLAYDICDQITQSNSDRESLRQKYKEAVAEARRTNAFEDVAAKAPDDTYITVRV